jgi:type IV pilus assembly protein PilA
MLVTNKEKGVVNAVEVKRNKGFTLVEIVVVLVVLAVLAAFTIPTMLGFVEEARGKAYIAEAREVYVAAQAVATEYIATTDITDGNVATNAPTAHGNQKWGTGLAVSLSSYEVKYRHDHFTSPSAVEYSSPQINASREMYRYLSKDTDISEISNINLLTNTKAVPTGNAAAWSVTIGEGDDNYEGTGSNGQTRTGKVKKIVYLRNGYRVTIENEMTTVEKYQ